MLKAVKCFFKSIIISFFFILSMCDIFNHFQMFNQHHVAEISPIWLWCVLIFIVSSPCLYVHLFLIRISRLCCCFNPLKELSFDLADLSIESLLKNTFHYTCCIYFIDFHFIFSTFFGFNMLSFSSFLLLEGMIFDSQTFFLF